LRQIFNNFLLVITSFLLPLLLLELCLRFLPVNDGFNFQPVNAQEPIYRAQPNQDVTASKGWNLENARTMRINNAGFRNDQDYTINPSGPLIAVVGDSYVEAIQVDYEDTFYGTLSGKLKNQATVYSFGFSGAPLSQYLVWAKHAVDFYGADYVAINVVSNDFDESLSKYGLSEGFYRYEECQQNSFCNKRNDYSIGKFRPIITSSALLRYLFFNVQVTGLVANYNARQTRYVSNVLETADPEVITDSKMAVDLFFRDLLEEVKLPRENIVFLVDGRVYDMNKSKFESSFFGQLRAYFIDSLENHNYQYIDLKEHYADHFKRHEEHFESANDAHWNELGHEIAAHHLEEFLQKHMLQ